MDFDYSAYLPEPTPFERSVIIEFAWGAQYFRFLCVAADVRTEPWQTGEPVEWLHFNGVQIFNAIPSETELKSSTKYLVPARYVTRFESGPDYRVTQGKISPDIAVFPPEHPTPAESIGVDVVRDRVAERLTAERN